MKRLGGLSRLSFALVVLLVLSIAVVTSGCWNKKKESQKGQATAKKEKVVRIGVILPLTGDAATYGRSCEKGMIIASEQFGIPLVFEDSAANPKKAINAFNKLVNVNNVKIIVGGMFSSTTLSFAPVAQREGILVLSPTAGAEAVPKTGDLIFSLYPSASVEGNYMARNLLRVLKIRIFPIKLGVVYSEEQVYADIAKGFIDGLKEKNGKFKLVFNEPISPSTRDFKNIISKLKTKHINAIYLSGDKTFVCNFIKQAKQLGWPVVFLSQSTLYDYSLLKEYGEYLEGVVFTGPYFNVNNGDNLTQYFVSSFKRKYQEEPDVWAAYGYDSILTIKKGLESCPGCDTRALSEALLKLDIRGLTGEIKFNKFGGAIRSFKLFKIENGKFKVVG